MRKSNSKFLTSFISEEGTKLLNRDYFGYVELDEYACYVMADSLDEDREINSAKQTVESIIRNFTLHPTMSKRLIKAYIKEAHEELKQNRGGMRLKASLIVVVTDYIKVRYIAIGNSRFYLLREDRFLIQSRDQSLTQNLIDEEELPKDKAALHEERNNLYAYLGQDKAVKINISKKIKLSDGDIIQIFSRGIWEYCDDGELLDASSEAKEPKEILDNVEELILTKQPDYIDNYTLVVTFINKIYKNPKKRFSVKQLLLVLIPVLIVIITVSVVLYINYKKKIEQTEAMGIYFESGEKYLSYDNYVKARDDYKEALTLSKSLKKDDIMKESDQILKLIDQILLGDSYLIDQEYDKAMEAYLTAQELSYEAGNIGKAYIASQLARNRQYIEVYDLLEDGDRKRSYSDLAGAKDSYGKAKQTAASLYFNEAKQEAMEKIALIEEELFQQKKETEEEEKQKQEEAEAEEKERKAEEKEQLKQQEEELRAEAEQELKEALVEQELENQTRLNEQKNAIEIENLGNEALKQKNYTSAVTFYETARSMFLYLDMTDKAGILKEKIKSAKKLEQIQISENILDAQTEKKEDE